MLKQVITKTTKNSCCIEMLWTLTANILLYTFMSTNMYLKLFFAAEFHLTNET